MNLAGVPESALRRLAASIDFSDRSVPGHRRSEPGPGNGVGPDVALQMEQALPGHITQLLFVVRDHSAQVGGIRDEPGYAVFVRPVVNGDTSVPICPVGLAVMVQWHSLSMAT